MRSRVLRGVAAGLAGSFVSRNNDSGGYWALGKLRSLASRVGSDRLRIQIKPLVVGGDPLLSDVATRYSAMLDRLVAQAGGPSESVERAEIVVHLAVDQPPAVAEFGTWGAPVACEVTLVDRKGREANARRVTVCGPHDPSLERRSTRGGA